MWAGDESRPPEDRKQKDVVFHVIGDSGAQLGIGERDDRRIIRFLFRFIMDAADFVEVKRTLVDDGGKG
nr:MAG: hypothetical protein [Bacteriophage sp.]